MARKTTKEEGHNDKVHQCQQLNVQTGVAPLALSAGGLSLGHPKISAARPFKEIVKCTHGDKWAELAAAAMKDQWRQRVSLALCRTMSNFYISYAGGAGLGPLPLVDTMPVGGGVDPHD